MKYIITLYLFVTSMICFGQNTFPASGNVGIGTTSPQSNLHINATGNNLLKIQSTAGGAGNTAGIDFCTFSTATSRVARIEAVDKGSFNGDLVFYTDGDGVDNSNTTEKMRISMTGNVGIGNNNPESVLQVDGGGLWRKVGLSTVGISTLGRLGQDGNGITMSSNAYYNGSWNRDDASKPSFALIEHLGNQRFEFRVAGASSGNIAWNVPMVVTASGFVGIGSLNPDQLLTVKGVVHASEVQIDLTVPGPDYVFENSYKLPKLEEVKTYVDANKHLPEVPSAKEMEKNGIQVGEMNMILLKKVEELTLYLIEQQRRNEELEKRVKMLEGRN